jgi:hypothetical protein
MAQDLQSKAMLVHFHGAVYSARKHDKAATETVAINFYADQKAGRYNKLLIRHDHLKPINSLISEARKFHYQMTLPWHDDGARILPSAAFHRYNTVMRGWQSEFIQLRDDFIQNYQSYISQAQNFLGNLYNADDYPDVMDIKDKFAFTITVDPLPTAEDFRVNLQSGELDKIREEIQERADEAKESAMKDLWKRLHETVSHMSDRLKDPNKIFRNSLVGNAIELCDLLPKLNITNDPDLESMRIQVQNKLCDIDPQTLRENSEVRKEVAGDAGEILNAMKGHINESN